MKVLVLGATGLAGQAIVRAAAARGHAVRGAARRGASVAVDISDGRALLSMLKAEMPDLVINCAALADIEACERDLWAGWSANARPLAFLAEWSNCSGGRLVHVSTDHYFPHGEAIAHDENAPVAFVNEYARQKYAGEALALTAANSLVLRTSIVGLRRWERPTFAEWAIDVVEHDKSATLFADAYTSSIDAYALAEGILDLAGRRVTGLLNIAAREVYSKEAFVRELAAQLGRRLTNAVAGSVSSLSVRRASCLGLDVRRAEAILARPLPSLQDVIRAVVRDHRGDPL